ncbi:hypothetical protein NKH77_27190 [Streptomyces sp. M19]
MHLLDEEATNRYVMSHLVKLFAQDSEDGRRRPGRTAKAPLSRGRRLNHGALAVR